jgi:cathepsin L
MLKITALALLVAATSSLAAARPPKANELTKDYSYEQYVRDFNRQDRSDAEHARRRAIFEAERDNVLAINAQKLSWRAGINAFSDMTLEEKKKQLTNQNYHGVKAHQSVMAPARVHTAAAAGGKALPFQVDWTKVRPAVVTAVKDQGQCGSCWAHASTETMESHYAIATGELHVLSQQQVTACTPNPQQCGGTGGCGGATHELAYQYATNSGGLSEEWIYPYTAYYGTTGKCIPQNDKYFKRATFNGYVKVNTNDGAALMSALTEGPVAVTVFAIPFLNYESGVFNSPACAGGNNASISLDHGVQAAGYGFDADSGLNYWLVRNSWSTAWGESGYIRMFRAAKPSMENCSYDYKPGDGVACKGDNKPEYVCGMCGILYDTSYPIAAPPQ